MITDKELAYAYKFGLAVKWLEPRTRYERFMLAWFNRLGG